jgi:signal transduction histidine kinase
LRKPASAVTCFNEMVNSANQDRRVYRRLRTALLAGLLASSAATSDAQSPVKQVLVLQSLDRGNLTLDHFTGEFRIGMDRSAGKPVNVVQVVVGQTGFVSAPEQAIVDYIRSMYTGRPAPDLIVTSGGPAAAFTRRHRHELFPATPLLFASVDQRWLRDAPLGENETAVAVVNDYPRLIDDILRVLPETRQVFMVVGAGALGHFWRRELETGFARFQGRVAFSWSDSLSFPDVLRRSATLPAHSAIVFITFGTDAQGGAYADEQVIADLHARANAPMFGSLSPLLGLGIVGGSMLSVQEVARSTADAASRILNGEPPARLRVRIQTAGPATFDWRELWRWGIPQSQLPPGSIVRFRPPSLWAEHKVTVLTAVGAIVLQSFLIALLLFESRARQRAEIESRRNLALAADANRRETISALTASIGHELGQPLSAIMNNAKTLEIMVARNRAAADATAEILADIKAEVALASQIIERHRTMLRSHQLQKKPIDLHAVIGETLALVAHDMRARQIETALELSSTPCIIDGDQVLLQQVLVNLVRNAMDALAERPPATRRITIRSSVTAANVEISVRDTGAGIPAEIIGTLFTPFVTTKSHGLGIGLTIAQRIVDAHAGSIVAHQDVDGGATFTVTLPRDGANDASGSFHRDRGIDAARPARRPQPGRQRGHDEQHAGDDERDRIPRLNFEQKTRQQPSGGERAD